MMFLEQINKRLALKQAEKKAMMSGDTVTCGVKLPIAMRDRLAKLKKHYGVNSIGDVLVKLAAEGLMRAEDLAARGISNRE